MFKANVFGKNGKVFLWSNKKNQTVFVLRLRLYIDRINYGIVVIVYFVIIDITELGTAK